MSTEGDAGRNVAGHGPSITVDIERADDLRALALKVAEVVGNRASDGLVMRSISHALDPDDAEGRWSAVMLFTELQDYEIRLESAG